MQKNKKDLKKQLDELMNVSIEYNRREIVDFLMHNFKEYYDNKKLQLYLEKSAAHGYISMCKILVNHGVIITNQAINLARVNNHNGTATFLAKKRALLRHKTE